MSFQIKRKAVPNSVPIDAKAQFSANPVVESPSDDPPPEYDFKDKIDYLDSPVVEGETKQDLDEQLERLQLETGHDDDLYSQSNERSAEPSPTTEADSTPSKDSKLKFTLREIKHFAGGLVTHPFEATKHYTVLRHSHGFVFYQGSTTSVAITVLSHQPLPAERTLWLQKRGFSGKTGLKVGTLGSRSAWIDVTPTTDATADQIAPDRERAWQRDISKFLKKTRDTKNISKHRPYETHIVRIPHVAEDGYFRIVLCAGREVLCPSPVFRYASSSVDPSVLRGASLSTLPLELAIKVGSLVAHHTANTAAAGALQPAVSTVQSAARPYGYSGMTQWAAKTAYDATVAEKVDSTVGSVNQQYDEKRQLDATSAMDGNEGEFDESGPGEPYPIRFSGKIASGLCDKKQATTFPTAKLVDVPQDTLLRLRGTYFGWVSLSKTKVVVEPIFSENLFDTWLPAIMIVDVESNEKIAVVEKKIIRLLIMRDFESAEFCNAKVSLMVMGE